MRWLVVMSQVTRMVRDRKWMNRCWDGGVGWMVQVCVCNVQDIGLVEEGAGEGARRENGRRQELVQLHAGAVRAARCVSAPVGMRTHRV